MGEHVTGAAAPRSRGQLMQVLAFTRYDRDAASTRYRLLQFLPALRQRGIAVEWHCLLPNGHMQRLVSGGRLSLTDTAAAYARRWTQLGGATRPDLLWIYAELFPYLPAWLEAVSLPGRVPIVIDWDDAFHIAYREHRLAPVRALLGRKFQQLFASASAVTCGNRYLQGEAARFCGRAALMPTVVDMDRYTPAGREEDPLTIGWIGSPSTYPNLRPLLPLLQRLHRDTGVRIRVVGAGREAEVDLFEGLELADWDEEFEVAEVQGFDIGIMPLLDRPFERGKSGFKLIQYMACGLPVIASPVGVNSEIVADGENGFLASTEEQWERTLRMLIADRELRSRMGSAGRSRVVERYSLSVIAPRLADLFEEVVSAS